jgi:acetyl coenzyme A synthetase (ADP forming)-like protein
VSGVTTADASLPPGYPSQWELDAVLSDGATVHIRPIRPDDARRLASFHELLSAESVRMRFFSAHPQLSEKELRRFTTVDYSERMAFVGELGGQIVAVGRYDGVPHSPEAEVAFVVADAHQRRGFGSLLLEYLAARARECGITRFVADTMAMNRSMLEVFRGAGFVETAHIQYGIVRVTLDIEPTGATLAAAQERERRAAVRSIARLLRPTSVAVVGAGRTPGGVGRTVVANLLDGGFRGPIHPVNPNAVEIEGLRAIPTVSAAPGPVDLAVICVPAAAVPASVEDCARKGVQGLVVVSSGFAEVGAEGRALEQEMVRTAHGAGMRIIGPNCIGVVNMAPDVSLNATFLGIAPIRGHAAFASQSGALGIALLERAQALGLGLSAFVSMGNKVDVSSNDLMRYWEQDASTRVILLYLESFGNPRTFARVARRVGKQKPIIALKAGRSAAGSRAAASHTASMASPDIAVDALFRQAGVIRVDTAEQLLDTGALAANQPLPAGRRVAIVTNGGGAGILAADACAAAGLEVPEPGPALRAALRDIGGPNAGVGNPVDLGAGTSAERFGAALNALLAGGEFDACIVILAPVASLDPEDVARAVASAATGTHPLMFVHLGRDDVPAPLRQAAQPIPCLQFPERAAHALGRVAEHADWRRRPTGNVPELSRVDVAAATAVVTRHLDRSPDGGWADPLDTSALLSAFGIPVVPAVEVQTAAAARRAVQTLGAPVVMKVVGEGIVHKSDVGGVVLGIRTPAAAAEAFASMRRRIGPAMRGALVQRMASPGVEVIVGVVNDPLFGPLVMFGSGGTAVELLGDRVFRILPLTDVDAAELVRQPRGSRQLFGYRGAPPADVAGLEDLLLRVARMAEEVPQLAEMDLNPVIVSAAGCLVVDARMRLLPWRAQPEQSVRRLR